MEFVIGIDHPSLPGHFPDRPLVPGVVLLDRVVDAIEASHGPLRGVRLQVKFARPLLPGEPARVELVPVEMEAEASRWRFRVLRGDSVLASGEIVADGAGS